MAVRFMGTRNLARFIEQSVMDFFGSPNKFGLGSLLNKIRSISQKEIDDIAKKVLDEFEEAGGDDIINQLRSWGDDFF